MSHSILPPRASSFARTLAPFLQAEGLPFADVLTAPTITQAFADAQASFGQTAQAFWTPDLTLWTFLSQVLDGDPSCRAAVSRALVAQGLSDAAVDLDTGNYCRARGKLPTAVLQQLTRQVSDRLEQAAPAAWLWKGLHVTLVDGCTVTLPDTAANQRQYPQPKTQKPGLGFPMIRLVVLLTLATATLQGLALGPYQGKETGEPTLFRALLAQLLPGSVVLGDRHYCSYFLVALLRERGVEGVFRLHQRRASDLQQSQCLGPGDYLVTWSKADQPDWMDAATYAAMPDSLQVREIHKTLDRHQYRVKNLVVVTTLLDAVTYTSDDIADLYHKRWHVELDIRALKSTLKMDVLRCLSPFMVEKEIWAHFLGYNLVRKVAAQAAVLRGLEPRSISFTASLQVVVGGWSKLTELPAAQRLRLARKLLRSLGKEVVGQRPGRCEPRALKRRPKKQKLLTKPRAQARAELLAKRAAGAEE
jgi:putative transposase